MPTPTQERSLKSILRDAIAARQPLMDEAHETAVRLFSGFSEGYPGLVIDLYAATVVLFNYASPPDDGRAAIDAALDTVAACLPWVRAAVVKTRNSTADAERTGIPVLGTSLNAHVRENGLLYALDLRLHQDCCLYLDTRNVRHWAKENLGGRTVLNAFAYTGSLGVAALGGGAASAVQLDQSRRFLDIARRSYALNHFPIRRQDFRTADFFRETARLRRSRVMFDCVFLDPPFFSSSSGGLVDQELASARLINKVRPLVARGGHLVAINNAIYVSGAAYRRILEELCKDGDMRIEELVPVPDDFVGMLPSANGVQITDPSPFNHSTKIAVLKRRD